eukprot:12799865-Alexandrium_andersonii.AAC.1
MSASLVGSEMCIRDRGRLAATLGTPPPPADAPGLLRSATWHGAATCGSNCLLYTSDAADDM